MDNEKIKKPFYKKWWVWVIAVILFICIKNTGSTDKKTKDVASKPAVVKETNSKNKEDEKKNEKEVKVENKKKNEKEIKVENEKNLGIKVTTIKTLFEKEEVGFKFSNSPLQDGTPRQLGKSPEGKGAAMLELYGKENLTKVYLGVFSASDSKEHNMFNITYMIGIIKNVCPDFKDPNKWINSSITELVENPSKTVTKDLGNKKVTMDLKKDLGLFAITIEPK